MVKRKMANVPNMSTTEAREAALGAVCLFLVMLPIEIRLLIYEMAFHGSRVHASLFKSKLAGPQAPALTLCHSSHFNLLLSCRNIYDEALATFWSAAVLEFGQPLERSRILASLVSRAEVRPDVYSTFMCNMLPEALKVNIRHIRGMVLPELNGEFVKNSSSCTATALLSNFKNLATCDISPTLVRHSFMVQDANLIRDAGTKVSTQFTTESGQEPKEYLFERYGIDTTSPVVFLSVTLAKIPTSAKDTQQILRTSPYSAVSYKRHERRL